MPQRLPRTVWCVPLFLLSAGLPGCGGAEKLDRVTGTVRYKGRPVPHLVVHFVPAAGRPSSGTTDEAGAYKLNYDREHDGAVPGPHTVYFAFRPRDPQQEVAYQSGKLALPPETKAVLNKYGSAEKANLKYDVNTDGQVIDIELD